MRYTPHSRITLFGNLNNVNDRRKPDGNGTWGEFDPTGGLTSNKRVGLDYGVFDKRDRFEFTGNVDVNFSDNDNGSMDETTYFLEGGDTYDVRRRRSSSSDFDISTRHKFNRNSGRNGLGLSLEPRFHYYNHDYSSLSQTGTFATRPASDYTALIDSLFSPSWTTAVRNLIKRNGQQSVGHEKGHDGSASFWTFIQIPYSLNGFTAEADVSYAKKESTNFNNFVYNYYDDAGNLMSDPRNRYRSTPSDDFAYRVMAKYIWHWTREIMLNPSYALNYKYTANDELHYRLDWIDESENQPLGWLPSQAEAMLRALDSDNSYSGSLHRYTHKFVLDWQWNRTKRTSGEVATWYLQIKPSVDVMQNDFRFRSATGGAPNEQNVKKTYLLPKAHVQLRRTTPGRRHSMMLTASLNSYAPSMTNLVDKTFASNPLYVTLGNPDLKPGMDFDVYFHYQADKWLQPKERQFYGNIGYHYSANATSMSYTYDRTTGVTTSRPINVNGNWNAYFNFGFQTPIDRKRKFTFNTATYANLYHIIDYASTSATVDPLRTTTMSASVSQDIKFNYRYKKLTAGVSSSVTYNRATADRDDFEDVNMWNIRCGANVVADLPWRMQLSTEFSLFARRGYGSDEMDRNDFVWNARLSKRVWKDRLTFMVDAWDMLGNLSNVVNGVNGQQRWAYAYNVIPRYVMLRAIYRLNIQPKKR